MRRTLVVDRVGAARQDDGAHAPTLQLGHGGVEGQQLGVDVELPDPASDELRELAAEVEDGDGAGGLVGTRDGLVTPVPIRGGRVERDLEIRLDLGVVGCQDPVPRVGARRRARSCRVCAAGPRRPLAPPVRRWSDAPVYRPRPLSLEAMQPVTDAHHPGPHDERADGETRIPFASDGAQHIRVGLDAAGLWHGWS